MDAMKKGLINVLEENLTNAMLQHSSIVVQTETADEIFCRNLIHIDNYDKDDKHISLYDNQFELHFNVNDSTEIDYDEFEKSFHLKNPHTDVFVSFLD
jgi:hypothetical protein